MFEDLGFSVWHLNCSSLVRVRGCGLPARKTRPPALLKQFSPIDSCFLFEIIDHLYAPRGVVVYLGVLFLFLGIGLLPGDSIKILPQH